MTEVAEMRMRRRTWLIMSAMHAGADMFMAREAVASVAIEHPEWDMDEERTWSEWQSS
jgi:hypothetical protein